MKRGIPKIAICLLLGLITTVAIAWASGAWLRLREMDAYAAGRTTRDESGWFLRAYKRPGAQFVNGYLVSDVTDFWQRDEWREDYLSPDEIDWPNVFEQGMDPRLETIRTIKMNARGWPWPCLYLEMFEAFSYQFIYDDTKVIGGAYWEITIPDGNLSTIDNIYAVLPWQPIWLGLFLDIVAFGGFWAIIFAICRHIRKRWSYLTKRSIGVALLTSILLGVVSTFVVVWYCANWVDETYVEGPEDVYGISKNGLNYVQWSIKLNAESGAVRLLSWWQFNSTTGFGDSDGSAEEFVPSWGGYLIPTSRSKPKDNELSESRNRVVDARGWPLLAMWGGFEYSRYVEDKTYIFTLGETKNAIVLPNLNEGEFSPDTNRVIPLAPIWFGFAVDTLFYAAIWLFLLYLLAGPGIIKRTIRHNRGHCIKCGYDLRHVEHEKCPECGAGVS